MGELMAVRRQHVDPTLCLAAAEGMTRARKHSRMRFAHGYMIAISSRRSKNICVLCQRWTAELGVRVGLAGDHKFLFVVMRGKLFLVTGSASWVASYDPCRTDSDRNMRRAALPPNRMPRKSIILEPQ